MIRNRPFALSDLGKPGPGRGRAPAVARHRRAALWLTLSALVVAGLWAPISPAAAEESPVCSDATSPERAAVAMAKACGRAVEVASATSEHARIVALPSGVLEWERYAVPVRVRRGDAWAPVDTTLQVRPDGRLAPRASTADVRFSRGGTDALVTLSAAGGSVALSWPGALPTPTAVGDTAVYAEVLPGVDLRVRATATGFTQVLVVKTAEAAANPALRSVEYSWSVRGLSVRSRGGRGWDVTDRGGAVLFSAAPGVMWDSRLPKGAVAVSAGPDRRGGGIGSTATAPGDAARTAPVADSVSGSRLVVTPDARMLADKDVVFPLYIDPQLSVNRNRWGYANSDNHNTNDGVARAGVNPSCCGGTWRSYFEFDISPLAQKFIHDARFYINAIHSGPCAASPVSLWSTGNMQAGVNGTRTAWAPEMASWADEKWVEANTDCGDPSPVPMEFGHELFYQVRWRTDRAVSPMTLGLATLDKYGHGEGSAYWKKFDPNTARMTVWFNTPPSPPVAQPFNVTTDCHKAETCASTVNAGSSTQGQGWWKLDETSGSTAADAASPAHPATAAGSWSWSDGGVAFTGGGDLYTSGPVLDTSRSFAVSAWAKLTSTGNFHTVVSQDGATVSAFHLRFDWQKQRWVFLRHAADDGASARTYAEDPNPPALNVWTHLVGVYNNDKREKSITLYVNGVRKSTVWADPVFAGTGPLLIGRAKWAGAPADRFVGGIDNVQVYQRPLTDDEVGKLQQAGRSGGALNLNPAAVRTTTPQMLFQVSDSDPNSQLWSDLEIRSAPTETSPVLHSVGGLGGGAASGTVVPHTVPSGKLVNGGTYYWRTRSSDEESWFGFWSQFQAVRVDTTAPTWGSPPVVSPQYPERQFGPINGTPGTFTFTAASMDVIEFEWWVDNQAVHNVVPATGSGPRRATVNYTPATPNKHFLHVKARDAVGLEASYSYEFWVESAPNVFAHWRLNETTGTAAADTGNAPAYGGSLSPLTLSDPGVGFGPGIPDPDGRPSNGLVFTGNASAEASGPVLDTTSDFTVMAWVNPSDLSADRTVLSQDGGASSRLQLQFDKDANAGQGGWCASMRASATAPPVSACADGSSVGLPVVNEWVHVAAVFNPDLTGRQLRVYLMGDPESCDPAETAAVAFTGSWSVTGAFAVGRARAASAGTEFWRGRIDDVRAHQVALEGHEICQIARPGD